MQNFVTNKWAVVFTFSTRGLYYLITKSFRNSLVGGRTPENEQINNFERFGLGHENIKNWLMEIIFILETVP